MNYLHQKLFSLFAHSHHVGILVAQQAHWAWQNAGRRIMSFIFWSFASSAVPADNILLSD
jgi:hypothetical protein